MERLCIVFFAVLMCIVVVVAYVRGIGWMGLLSPEAFVDVVSVENSSSQQSENSSNKDEPVTSLEVKIFPSELTTTLPSLYLSKLTTTFTAGSYKLVSSLGSSARTITFWSMDSHPGPVQDLRIIFKRILEPAFEMRWFEYDFSAMCGVTDSCVKSKKMLSVLNHGKIWSGSGQDVSRFYTMYRDDPDIQSVDAFVISMPPSVIRFMAPFGKPMICHFSIPFQSLSKRTVLNLLRNSSNILAVNNGLLQKFASVWIGKVFPLVSNLCFYMGSHYIGNFKEDSRKKVLVMRRPWPPGLYDARVLNNIAEKAKVGVSFVAYPLGMKWKSLGEDYAAVAFFPYTVSVMVFYETYNVNIPILMPSAKLASANELKYAKDARNFWVRKMIAPLIAKTSEDLHSWYSSTDFYNGLYPHLSYFESISHLLKLMEGATQEYLMATSKQMARQTERLYNSSMRFWSGVLGNLTRTKER